MNPAHENSAATSIEDVLAGAMWVSGLTDPSLSAARLHETFLEVIFSFPGAAASAGDQDQQPERSRLRTAAEVERDRLHREELRREAADLRGEGRPADPFGDSDAEDSELFDESGDDEDEDEQLQEDADFLSWIDSSGQVAQQRQEPEKPVDESAIELELGRVGLGEREAAVESDWLPERLTHIEMKDKRPRLGPKILPGGFTYSIPLELEAYWVLRQLRNAGQPLAHNTRICALANRTQAEIADEPVLVAIAYALQKMTREFMEPAQLMLYHQSHLHPLLHALLDGSPLMAAAEHSIPVPSLAYSSLTGRRQRPFLSATFVGFAATGTDSIGDGDPTWRRLSGVDYAVRKPCFVELGRLLVRILELDSLCHTLEYRRQQMLIMLRDSTDARVQDQRSLLEGVVFENAVDADLWHTFVQTLIPNRSRGAHHRVRALGLEDAFEEYTITALQFQENLIQNAPINLCQQHPPMGLQAWAQQVGSVMSPPRSADSILALFNNAIVDSFSKLPLPSKQLLDMFCSEGDLIVSYLTVQRKDDIFPLASFFIDHPRHYIEFAQKERQGAVRLFYVIDEALIRRELKVDQLYQQWPTGDAAGSSTDAEWHREREKAMQMLVYRLIETVIPKVKSELLMQTKYQLDTSSVQRLGLLCAHGPYEPTRLALDAYTGDADAWEPEWNVVEALPRAWAEPATLVPALPRRTARVCAVFQSDNGITSFAFVDENGVVVGTTRWSECAMNSPLGRAAALMQSASLEKMFVQCRPAVIAVAAAGSGVLRLMREMQDFVRDRVLPTLGVDVEVVWAAPDVARFCSESSFADLETPTTDHAMRTSIALARSVQEPLAAVATLFDAKHTVVRMFLAGLSGGALSNREHEEQLLRRLAWEMSLWVAASGFWLEDCVNRPSSVALLQFVPGLGPAKARALVQSVTMDPVHARSALRQRMIELFGECVAFNAEAAIRVGPHEGADDWHPLDQTLIPTAWYGVAEALATVIATAGSVGEEEAVRALPLVRFMEKTVPAKRDTIARATAKTDYLSEVQQRLRPRGVELVPGNSEYLFVVDELVAGGQSFLRRPYRRLSTRELMMGITGVTFVTRSDLHDIVQRGLVSSSVLAGTSSGADGASSNAAALSGGAGGFGSFVVKEGDYVTGTVSGVRGGANGGIRLVTSRGLNAFIAMENITDEAMRGEMEHHVRFLESTREARDAGTPLSDTVLRAYETPAWLRRGSLAQGVALRCNWARCELHLRWCPPREVGQADDKRAQSAMHRQPPSYASMVGYSAGNGLLSGPSTLGQELSAADNMAFGSGFSRHVYFKNINHIRANEELRDREIGEKVLRPSSGHRKKAVCVVKLGLSCCGNWVVSEERKFNGKLYYILTDKTINTVSTYDDIDDLLRNYIDNVVGLVKQVRHHRRFVQSQRDVNGALADQLRSSNGRGFAYCFVETGILSKPPLYRVVTMGGGKEYKFRLHFTDKAIYVKLPLATSRSGVAEFKWVECRNAEQVSEMVKKHALALSCG